MKNLQIVAEQVLNLLQAKVRLCMEGYLRSLSHNSFDC